MATGTGVSLSQIERTWLADKVAGTIGTTSLNDIKRKYFTTQLGAVPSVNSLVDLEKRWLRSKIVSNGKTPSGDRLSDLWVQLVASVAGLRVSKFINDNKKTYYLNVA